MDWLEALALGVVQGLTEFLPVSSSGHLEIAKHLFGVDPESSFTMTVVLHGATVLSTVVVFWQEILQLFKGFFKFKMNEETKYIFKIIISMIPVGIVGVFFKDKIEEFFNGNMVFIGSMLLVTAILLASAHFIRKRDRQIGYLDAFIIGIAQAFATIPGISRSGATICTGLLIGNDKDSLAKFSFLMVLIPIIGANLLELVSGKMGAGGATPVSSLIIGFIAAFISGYMACRWMIALVKKSKLIWFALYCCIIGIVAMFL
ncbi:MAG: undecaprenyl-diphosphate phosphatase [Bacteroidales bacterium]|nr:undecaprenyl-diphosphate phosphatase [Bacteroidales bacterium]